MDSCTLHFRIFAVLVMSGFNLFPTVLVEFHVFDANSVGHDQTLHPQASAMCLHYLTKYKFWGTLDTDGYHLAAFGESGN